jgi:hypothetical protein
MLGCAPDVLERPARGEQRTRESGAASVGCAGLDASAAAFGTPGPFDASTSAASFRQAVRTAAATAASAARATTRGHLFGASASAHPGGTASSGRRRAVAAGRCRAAD